MNTQRNGLIVGVLGVIGAASGSHGQTLTAEYLGLPIGQPTVQRMIIEKEKTYAMDFVDPRGNYGRAFIALEHSEDQPLSLVSYYVFGRIVPPPGKLPGRQPRMPSRFMGAYRWTVGGGTLFKSSMRWIPSPAQEEALVLLYPMRFFVVDADGTGRLDRVKLPGPTLWVGGKSIPHYSLSPTAALRAGAYALQDEGEYLSELWGLPMASEVRPKEAYYDIVGVDDERVELYVTADGKLQRWTYELNARRRLKHPIVKPDGKKQHWVDGPAWRLVKNYSFRVNGPFLICKDGDAAVAERDGRWCLIDSLEAEEPSVRPIVPKIEGEPLLVIEDRVGRAVYFEQQEKFYDENGVMRLSLSGASDTPAKIEAIDDFVRALHTE